MKKLDWTKPVQTRGGSEIKIYEVFYNRYVNGCYYEQSEDIYYPCQWDLNGKYGDKPCSLDLINIKAYPDPESA